MENSEENYLPREIKLLVIHCSATRCNVSFTVEQLRQCHLQRGFKDIGYHFYITRNGELHHCRPVSEPGAHVRGFNRHSIGICYEGGLDEEGRPADTRTQAQRFALLDLLTILKHQYPDAQILGHYQLSASIHKACPCFDSRKEYMNSSFLCLYHLQFPRLSQVIGNKPHFSHRKCLCLRMKVSR